MDVGHLTNRRLDVPSGSTIKCAEYSRTLADKANINLFSRSINSALIDKVKFHSTGRL